MEYFENNFTAETAK